MMSLGEGEQSLGELREATGTISQSIIPALKKMEHARYVEKTPNGYALTAAGMVIYHKLQDFVLTAATLHKNMDFWSTHHIEGIPAAFLDRIGSLWETTILKDSEHDVLQVYGYFIKIVQEADHICLASTILSVWHANTLYERVGKIPIDLLVTEEIVEMLMRDNYREMFLNALNTDNFSLHVCRLPIKMTLTITDRSLSFGLYRRDQKTYDMINHLASEDIEALKWGSELFEYLKKHSKPLTIEELNL